jgi:fructokinase
MTSAAAPPFVVAGESLVDIVVPIEGPTSYAAGGSSMNVAVGLSRLEVPTVLLTELGHDDYGALVAEHLRASGIPLGSYALQTERRTGTATARLNEHHAASYEFDLAWELPRQSLPECSGLHVGSLGASLEPGRQSVLDLVHQARDEDVLVSYDPNVRPVFVTDPKLEWERLTELAALATLVKASDEDFEALRPGELVDALVRELLDDTSTEMVVVTRGGRGATAFTQQFTVDVTAPGVTVVDTVGAGDSFTAATLAILTEWGLTTTGPGSLTALDEERVSTLLTGAVTAAAVTCSRRGADPPTRAELPATWPWVQS